jgi:acyl-CoA thioesterase-1
MKSIMMSAVKNKMAREIVARGIIVSFLGMFVMACSGCGGGGGSSPSTAAVAAPASTPLPPKPVIIDAEGDSTMLGTEEVNGKYIQTANSAPADLQAILQKQYGTSVTVENHGSGGSNIGDRINGTAPWYTTPLANALSTDTAQIVIGNWALNDSGPQNGESVAQYQAYLVDFVTQENTCPRRAKPDDSRYAAGRLCECNRCDGGPDERATHPAVPVHPLAA